MKKDTLVMIGSVILFVALVAMMAVEATHPQGGAAMLSSLFGGV